MSLVDDFWMWVDSIWGKHGQIQAANQTLPAWTNIEALNNYWSSLPPEVQNDATVQGHYRQRALELKDTHAGSANPLAPVIQGMLDDWKDRVAKYDLTDPSKADETLAGLAADVLAISAGAGIIELALGALPNGEGTVASTKVSQLMGWLGFGAVVTAVAHDPVKIGLLRPYQDTLEAHFRNRRPGDRDLFTAYQQRSLSATKIDDVEKITDDLMAKIESENETYYDTEIAKWGYSPYFSNALKDAATKTLTFGNLMALAKQGRLNRGMAIYSLWGYGLDRRLMKTALDALDQTNEVANYDGFRAVIERGYTDGLTTEADLRAYYKKLHVPDDVVAIVLPHLTKLRNETIAKQKTGAAQKERDLTISQVQQAYEASLLDRAGAQNMILTLGYSLDETRILLDLADTRKKLPGAVKLKRLPLTDYEKAQKNKIITIDQVLDRMRGEYTQDDIALEKKLLEIGKA